MKYILEHSIWGYLFVKPDGTAIFSKQRSNATRFNKPEEARAIIRKNWAKTFDIVLEKVKFQEVAE